MSYRYQKRLSVVENNNQPSIPPPNTTDPPLQPIVINSSGTPNNKTADNLQHIYEWIMLGLAILTIFSFVINNGFLLTIGIVAFMLVAIISITKSLANKTKQPATLTSNSQLQSKKPRSILKILGMTLLIIALLPVFFYGGLMVLFIIFMVLNGGNANS